MATLEDVKKYWKKRGLRFLVAFLTTSTFVPFITYDTGIRCVTSPCHEAAARGSLFDFVLKSNNFNAYIIDPLYFFVVLIALYLILEYLNILIHNK